ncbi:MAG: hypothetical protein HYV27_20685 [Candidatus Hydrogenedentes bacterium]|nr:hypothetical protein [Candidatus Hydrogenedentota bacterium]
MGNTPYFVNRTPLWGKELWRADSPGSAHQVADLMPNTAQHPETHEWISVPSLTHEK